MLKLREWVQLIIWVVIFETIGFFLGMLTQSNIHTWYMGLNKSALTPPGFVFSIVWSLLYVLLAVVGWVFWCNRANPKIKHFANLYFIQLVMNWAWTPLFFQFHWIGLSFLWIVTMVFLTMVIIVGVKNEKKAISLTLIPYLMWLVFASYLNGLIWILN